MSIKRILIPVTLLALLLASCNASGASEPMYIQSDVEAEYYGGGSPVEEKLDFDAPMGAPAPQSSVARDGVYDESGEEEVDRIVIKNANLSLVVDDPSVSMDEIAAMAEALGGYVVSSNLYQMMLESGAEVPQAFITIRVPAEVFTQTLDDIKSGAGRVLSENVSGQDVTREYTDLQSRLTNLENAEVEMTRIMEEANRTEDVINAFNHLTGIREQIEVLKGQIKYYEQSAAFSAISVDLIAEAAAQPLTIGGWQPVGVAKDAIQALINTLKAIANTIIWLALYGLPTLVVLALPIWLVFVLVRGWWRKRKTKAVQASEA